MVAQPSPQRMSVDEWRELEHTSHDIRHEYIDGRVYAMSGGSLAYSRSSLNVCALLLRMRSKQQESPTMSITRMRRHASHLDATHTLMRP